MRNTTQAEKNSLGGEKRLSDQIIQTSGRLTCSTEISLIIKCGTRFSNRDQYNSLQY